ncbi:hypothetical protein R2103_05495 [Nitrosomonas sp. Is24]|uniref:hypothetical protein n=1 Tax=Nitrosomonas sp. Is24 TaxID=3080533 RepID=UPI00294AD7AE|nr:hypothetical protein [Nitrosomonas sp. Is24]MDV6341220.1 hypothetical protein [Nitrosomonas sp. Is24]
MSKNLEARVEQLEIRIGGSRKPVPGLIYISPNQTFEEAAAEYEKRNGFKLPKDAHVIKIVAYDARKKGSDDA